MEDVDRLARKDHLVILVGLENPACQDLEAWLDDKELKEKKESRVHQALLVSMVAQDLRDRWEHVVLRE